MKDSEAERTKREMLLHEMYTRQLEKMLNTPIVTDKNAPPGHIFGFQAPIKVHVNHVNEGVSGE